MFTLEQISAFTAVYQHGSYSAAARALDKDRTTIREHVLSLEDNLGLPLFTILGRSARPTDLAHRLYPRAEILARQAQEFTLTALAAFDHSLTTLNIYHDVLLPSSMVIQIEQQAAQHFPQLQLNWLHRNRDETLNDLVSGEAHLAIMPHRNKIIPEKQIWYRNLGMLPLSIYVGKDHPLAAKTDVSLKDLQLNKQYISENHLRAGIDMMKISPHQHIISNNDVLIALLKHQGWAVLSRIFAEEYVESGELVELALTDIVNAHRHGLTLYYPTQLESDPTIGQFIVWFSSYAKQYMD
ncbi:LysR family transcriptional regulator [Photobacterium rosenbergii]|uniref:LysR family transcriptional regulator n=1 Tax=Photobacterium rosenbergii TaxID=294936 RepID=A0ABU3ZIL4_9GAMM|nr:LysR family transcriptional regulator [Photobacterium rosenbergii]MDV5169857.1 LysR family transcriptional regulator [Photobacterium rosenbergii]